MNRSIFGISLLATYATELFSHFLQEPWGGH